jgi:hypothetical protein
VSRTPYDGIGIWGKFLGTRYQISDKHLLIESPLLSIAAAGSDLESSFVQRWKGKRTYEPMAVIDSKVPYILIHKSKL